MESQVVFSEPVPHPTRGRESSRTSAVRAALPELKARRGEWARILGPLPPGSAAYVISRIRNGKYGGEPGEYDARQGTVDGRVYVWAVYGGDGS